MYNGTPDQNIDEAFEQLGTQIDKIENLMASLTMPVSDKLHVNAIREVLPDIHASIKQAYFELGGDDVWSD